MATLMDQLRDQFFTHCLENNLLGEQVVIRARALTAEEAIGNPEGDDFPLKKGKERLMQAEFHGALGQAFTDRFGHFEGSVNDIFDMPLENNYRRAVFLASLNAVLRHLGLIAGTVHCRDQGPKECAERMVVTIRERFGRVNITLVGFQPSMAQALSRMFPLRLLDLDPANIGLEKAGVVVEGPETTAEAVDWADLLVVTGTTLANGTIERFLTGKPALFYGTTIAGPAHLMGLDRFCAGSG